MTDLRVKTKLISMKMKAINMMPGLSRRQLACSHAQGSDGLGVRRRGYDEGRAERLDLLDEVTLIGVT